jgi:macrodomain Ter protein organizer (MatP/YcbG family)
MAPEDVAGNVVGFVGEIEAASQVVSNLITSIPTEINNLKSWITMEFNSKVKTKLDQAVQIVERLPGEVSAISNKLETKGNEITNTIQTTFERLKPRVLSVAEIVEDEMLKATSKIQLFFNEATVIDNDLLGCIESFTPEVAKFVMKAVTFGGDEMIKKILTEMLKPQACLLCSSKFSADALRRFNCLDGQRRLSDDLWHAIDLYGPDKKRIGEDAAQTTEQNNEFNNKISSEQELKSSPVANDLGTCPHAPEVSAKPAYSDTSHYVYSVAMQPLQLLSITNPSEDNQMWDTRTDQNIVAAVLLAELILNTIFEYHGKICDAIPETICFQFCGTNTAQALCWSMIGIGAAFRAFFASILAAVDLHDGVIDGAEIEATLINTEKLVNWTCEIEKHVSAEFETMEPAQISYTEVKDQSLQLIDRSDPNPAEVREWVSDISNKVDSLQTAVIAEIEALTNEFRKHKSIIHRRLLTNQ